MLFDVFEGLSDEYRTYQVIRPEQLNFRRPSDDAERSTLSSLTGKINKEAVILFIVGVVLIAAGVVVVFCGQTGGILLAGFGGLLMIPGIIKLIQSKTSGLVASGILVKKDKVSAGSIQGRSRRTYRWLVIAVDGMDDTLCPVHAEEEDYQFAGVGDRILVIKDNAVYRGKKMG